MLALLSHRAVEAKDYNIVDYGAVSDTTRLSTEAIQRAVDDCSAAGGGRVVVPADEKEKDYPEATMWGVLPAKGFFVQHARNVNFRNVTVMTAEPDERPEYVKVDVE